MLGGTATVVIEARTLMREALVSFIESHSYQVICSVACPADIDCGAFEGKQPELVILGALPVDRVAGTARRIRRRWQDAKIIVLFDHAPARCLQQLLASDVDACIPMDASPRSLLDTLRLVVCEPLRVLMMGGMEGLQGPTEESMQKDRALEAGLASTLETSSAIGLPCAVASSARGDFRAYALSEREEQILRALVRGYSNKMIARMHSLAEATVKVHMKAILRKIRVANRTQAAIWAVRNDYFSHEPNEETAKGDGPVFVPQSSSSKS
jgi:two-component system nitrate/nitrite response regulator NarL